MSKVKCSLCSRLVGAKGRKLSKHRSGRSKVGKVKPACANSGLSLKAKKPVVGLTAEEKQVKLNRAARRALEQLAKQKAEALALNEALAKAAVPQVADSQEILVKFDEEMLATVDSP